MISPEKANCIAGKRRLEQQTGNFARAQQDSVDTKNYVLCNNSYAEFSPWSNRIVSI